MVPDCIVLKNMFYPIHVHDFHDPLHLDLGLLVIHDLLVSLKDLVTSQDSVPVRVHLLEGLHLRSIGW
jgi:hypothetical protein